MAETSFFPSGRLLHYSKTGYITEFPNNRVIFNARIVDAETRTFLWGGDLDLTIDGKMLQRYANSLGKTISIHRESDRNSETAEATITPEAVVS